MDEYLTAFYCSNISQLFIGHQPKEYIYNLRIEIFSRLFLDVLQGFLFGPGGAIRAVTGQCIPNIYDGEDTSDYWNLLTFEPAWIPCAVPFFMVAVGNI